MNKDLYGHRVSLPEDVVSYLQQCRDAAVGSDDSTEGYKRNQDLVNKREVSYQQLKRMKNWFDNFDGHENDLSYILNGGHYVKSWINKTLDSLRNDVKLGKEVKSEVLPNQFIQNHEKTNLKNMNRPSKSHSDSIEYYDMSVTEQLKRINQLIDKIL